MIEQISPLQRAAWLASARAQGLQPVVLDVREPEELAIASVASEGLPLLCIPMGTLPQRISELDPAQPVACLCHHGARSMRVAQYLASQSFEQLANIAGGIDAWSVERNPAIARY